VIPPLWDDDKIPKDWTKWRVIDYCDNQTTAVPWIAVGPVDAPNGRYVVAVCYRLLYEKEMTVSELVRRIVEMSHNRRVEGERWQDEKTEVTYPTYKEVQDGEQFYSDLLDSRVAPLKRNGIRLIDLFRQYGMENLREACGDRNEEQIPRLKDWLEIDFKRAHPWLKDEAGKPVMGCPKLFFFDGRTEAAVAELENMPSDPGGGTTHVIDKSYPHDFIDAAKYWASDSPAYMGDEGVGEGKEKEGQDEERTPYTGW
jgi:hypothetical protein